MTDSRRNLCSSTQNLCYYASDQELDVSGNATVARELSLPDGRWTIALQSTLPLTGSQGMYVSGSVALPYYVSEDQNW